MHPDRIVPSYSLLSGLSNGGGDPDEQVSIRMKQQRILLPCTNVFWTPYGVATPRSLQGVEFESVVREIHFEHITFLGLVRIDEVVIFWFNSMLPRGYR